MDQDINKRSTFSIKVTFNQYRDPEQEEVNICDDDDRQNPGEPNTTTKATCSNNNQIVRNKQHQTSSQLCCCVSQRERNNENISHRCNITLDKNQRQQVYCCNHFKKCNGNEDIDYDSSAQNIKTKQFRYIQPQNHKSSLFVNLSQNISRDNNYDSKEDNPRRRDNLFVSPDLDINLKKYSTVISKAPVSPNSTINSSSSIEDYEDNNLLYNKLSKRDMFSCLHANTSSSQTDLTGEKEFEEDSASLRESFEQIEYSDIDSDMEQLTKSTDTTTNTLTNSDTRGDDYYTNETIIMEQNQATKDSNRKSTITYTQPPKDLKICNLKDQKSIPTELDLDELNAIITDEDCAQILSMDLATYAKQVDSLQGEIDLCEGCIAILERKRCVGSQTCITKIIKQRRNIRDLQMQVYEKKLNELLLSSLDQNLASPTDLKHFDDNCKKMEANKLTKTTAATARSSSPHTMTNTTSSTTNDLQPTLKPRFEDTADILNAVPPPPEH